MKNIIIIILVLVVAVVAYMQFGTTHIDTFVDTDAPNKSQTEATKPELIYKEETWEMNFPDGSVAQEEIVATPYVVYGEEEVKVFEEIAGLRIDEESWSPSQKYIYFAKGNGKDATVIPYLFDTKTRLLHKVCLDGGSAQMCTDPLAGFAAQEYVTIAWSENDTLNIEYQNPGLASGMPESGPAIGLQVFESVSAETPWVTEQIN